MKTTRHNDTIVSKFLHLTNGPDTLKKQKSLTEFTHLPWLEALVSQCA